MVRALLICSLYNIASFRRLCSAISENIAYRWFCFLTIDDPVFDHSAITYFINRIGREGFSEVFEGLNQELLRMGLLSPEIYADSSMVKANVNNFGLSRSDLSVEESKEEGIEENGLFVLASSTVDDEGVGPGRHGQGGLRSLAYRQFQKGLRRLRWQVVGQVENTVFIGCPDIFQPFQWDAVAQQLVIGQVGEQQGLGRRLYLGPHVHWHRNLLHDLPQFHQLGGAVGGVHFQLPALRPPVGVVVAAYVAEDDILPGPVQDDAQVQVHPGRPEIRIAGSGQAVQAEARLGKVGLKVEGGGLGRLLLLVGQPGEAGGERIGYAELQGRFRELSPVIAGHDSHHKLVEHRNSKCSVTVIGAPDHSLAYQLISRRGQSAHLSFQLGGYITRTMRPWPQMGHCPHIFLFKRRKPVKSDQEEAPVKRG